MLQKRSEIDPSKSLRYNNYLKITDNNFYFSQTNKDKQDKVIANFINYNKSKNCKIKNGKSEPKAFHNIIFEEFQDFKVINETLNKSQYTIEFENFVFDDELLDIIVRYFYTMEIEQINYNKIFSFLDILFYFQNFYLMEKVFSFLESIIKQNQALEINNKTFLNFHMFFFYTSCTNKFEHSFDQEFLDSFKQLFRKDIKLLIEFYFQSLNNQTSPAGLAQYTNSPDKDLQEQFLKLYNDEFFQINAEYKEHFKSLFEMIIEILKEIPNVEKQFILKLSSKLIPHLAFESDKAKHAYLRALFSHKFEIDDISINNLEKFVLGYQIFDETEELTMRLKIITNENEQFKNENKTLHDIQTKNIIRMEEMLKAINKLEDEIKRKDSLLDLEQAKRKEVENKLVEKDFEFERFNQEIAKKAESEKNHKKTVDNLNKEIKKLNEEIKSLKEMKSALETEAIANKEKCSKDITKLTDEIKLLKETQTASDSKEKTNQEKSNNEISGLKEQISALEADKQNALEIKKTNEDLKNLLNTCTDEKNILNNEFKSIQSIIKTSFFFNANNIEGSGLILSYNNLQAEKNCASHCAILGNIGMYKAVYKWKVKLLEKATWSQEYWLLLGVHTKPLDVKAEYATDSALYALNVSNNLNGVIVKAGVSTTDNLRKVDPLDEVEITLNCGERKLFYKHKNWEAEISDLPADTVFYPYFDPFDLSVQIIA